jgi:hypothetical protein
MNLVFLLAVLMLLCSVFELGYLLRPKYWWLAFRLHVLIPLKRFDIRKAWVAAKAMPRVFFGPVPRCWSDGCRRTVAKFEPRYGFACAFHWNEFIGDCADLAK